MPVYIHIYASTEIYLTFTALGKFQNLSHIFPLLYGLCSSNHLGANAIQLHLFVRVVWNSFSLFAEAH